MKAVAVILKRRFPNLTVAETMGLCYELVEAVENKMTPRQRTCKQPCDDPACPVHGVNASLSKGHE